MEDGETIEMIEKKFEAMEEYSKQIKNSGSSGSAIGSPTEDSTQANSSDNQMMLTEEQLEDMFKITSAFTIDYALIGTKFEELVPDQYSDDDAKFSSF